MSVATYDMSTSYSQGLIPEFFLGEWLIVLNYARAWWVAG